MFTVQTDMSCDSCLIYAIQCVESLEEYIGETGDTLKNRMTVHRQQIIARRTRKFYMRHHIDKYAREMSIQFNILSLHRMNTESVMARKSKESYFIHKLLPVR